MRATGTLIRRQSVSAAAVASGAIGPAFVALLLLLVGFPASRVSAGPPFLTDDPEPVEYKHWEFYIAGGCPG